MIAAILIAIGLIAGYVLGYRAGAEDALCGAGSLITEIEEAAADSKARTAELAEKTAELRQAIERAEGARVNWKPESEQQERRDPGSELRPFEPCFCGSGTLYQGCCKPKLKYYLFDHPVLLDVWDVLAYSEDDARERFKASWSERTAAGGSHAHLSGSSFESGGVRLDG